MHSPIPFDPAMETPEKDEQKTQSELIETLLSISKTTLKDEHEALRAVHAKSHALLKARLTVLDDLPAQYAQGLFAKPGTYDAIVRLSSAPGDLLPDSVSTHHGLGLKIKGVNGAMLAGSEPGSQDILFANGKAFNAPDVAHFLKNLKMLAKTTDKVEGLKVALSGALRTLETGLESVGGESALLTSMGGHPAYPVLSEEFFSQVPVRYGDYVAKLGLFPVTDEQAALKKTKIDLDDGFDPHRQAVRNHLADHPAAWDLRVQLCTDRAKMPVEKPDVAWPEDLSPYVTVARLDVPVQESYSDAMAAYADKGSAFSPWNGLEAHRPLGAINRVRKAVYEASAQFRMGHNGCPFHNTAPIPA